MTVRILHGDALEQLRTLADESVHSIVTDPPYELTSARPGGRSDATRGAVMGGFMGMKWDGTGIAFDVELWTECLRVLKPGGHLLSFGGSRTYHRMACAIEDAGFEIRDQIMWIYGSGFPKSLDVSKAIDRAAGATREATREAVSGDVISWDQRSSFERARFDIPTTAAARQWQGWGTALKPAHEPIVVARKPLQGTVAANVLKHGTGAINVDGCRVGTGDDKGIWPVTARRYNDVAYTLLPTETDRTLGRWPANIIHDGSDEVLAGFPETESGNLEPHHNKGGGSLIGTFEIRNRQGEAGSFGGDSGSAARFFYTAKASRDDRNIGLQQCTCDNQAWVSADRRASIRPVTGTQPLRATTASTTEGGCEWRTLLRGSDTTADLFPADFKSITETRTNRTTTQTTSISSIPSLTSDFTPAVNCESAAFGGSRASSAEIGSQSTLSTGISPEKVGLSTEDADLATSESSSRNGAQGARCPNCGALNRSTHPTVKPTDLMQYLVRLVTPPGGTVLDPFAGSGSTGLAADREGFDAILIEREAEYVEIARRRIVGDCPLFAELAA